MGGKGEAMSKDLLDELIDVLAHDFKDMESAEEV